MPHSILRNDVAGRDVTRYLKLLLRKEGYTFKTTAEFEIVKSIKERVCFLSPTAQKDETSQGDKSQFTLPDGTSIEVEIILKYYYFYLIISARHKSLSSTGSSL
jgi:centractin